MTEGTADIERKVEGGKRIRIFVRVMNSVIKDLGITGDFFAYPDDAIARLENTLRGREVHAADFPDIVESFFRREDIKTAGVTPSEIAAILIEALRKVS